MFDEEKMRDYAASYVPYAPFEALRGQRIVVTGVTGMIGTAVAELLLAADRALDLGLSIVGVGRDAARAEERFGVSTRGGQTFTFLSHDLCTPLELEGRVDAIIHAASPAYPAAFAKTPVETMLANLDGTHHLLDLAREKGASFLFVSSGEIYGTTDKDTKAEDDYGYVDAMQPRSCYPNSKRAAETLCACYAAEYGIRAVVARLSHTYGPTMTERDNRAATDFLRAAHRGEDIVLRSTGAMVRSYTYVYDVATALVTLLVKGDSATAYNVADPASVVSIRELAEQIATLGGRQVTLDLPQDAGALGYTTIPRQVMESTRLCALGWQPRQPLAANLADTLTLLA